ncbi:DUF4834 family protein [Flavobacterium selenitireducens]|uniref:DUF4834 family protein n=1 Tax=Flavobacterium selenitireducens TaxID=2722704 RepID=UPI00168A4AE8|nr:DUF4834 family protein [Flavobacterium selenitireducens]MBD3581522.1 DUF4834 family protein [Flavobacterium selenitireducens]
METANFPNFVRTIFFIIAFYYIFRFLARLFFPMLVKKAVEHAQENMRDQFNQYQNAQRDPYRRPEGEVTIDTSNAAKPRETKKVGDYIDYEEIK